MVKRELLNLINFDLFVSKAWGFFGEVWALKELIFAVKLLFIDLFVSKTEEIWALKASIFAVKLLFVEFLIFFVYWTVQ